MSDDPARLTVDTTRANAARRYDYWLGGKDNFAADRASADAIAKIFPHIVTAAVQNRRFLQRAVNYLAGDGGVRQFLDIGTGPPTADNTHEVAQRVDPCARVVYVDNDPVVMVHARARLAGTPQGRTAYLHADLREPDGILNDPDLTSTLDLAKPVGLLLVAVLHFIDNEQAYAAVKTFIEALVPGSYLVVSHATDELLPAETTQAFAGISFPGKGDVISRTRAEVARFFDGLDLVPPGLQVVSQWRPTPGHTAPPPEKVSVYGAVACKPHRLRNQP